jgi:hypothetical protein
MALLATLLLFEATWNLAPAATEAPVLHQTAAELRETVRCNLATIYRVGPSGTIRVRERPTKRSRVVGRLPEGNIVYVCDDSRGWLRVYFGSSEGPCFRTYEGGLRFREARKCTSGWVQAYWVNILSG